MKSFFFSIKKTNDCVTIESAIAKNSACSSYNVRRDHILAKWRHARSNADPWHLFFLAIVSQACTYKECVHNSEQFSCFYLGSYW